MRRKVKRQLGITVVTNEDNYIAHQEVGKVGEASSSERIREEKKNRDDFDTKMKLEQISQRTEL